MKNICLLGISLFFLIGCTKTSNPANMAGKIDMSKPVDYVVVSKEEKDKTLYILTGQSSEASEEVSDEINGDEQSSPQAPQPEDETSEDTNH